MKGRQLLDAMAYIDDVLIEEAAPLPENERPDIDMADFTGKRYHQKRMTACAAVFAVAAVSLWVWKSGNMPRERELSENEQYAGAYDTGSVGEGDDALAENAPAEALMADYQENAIDDDAAALKENNIGDVRDSGGVLEDTEAAVEQKKDGAAEAFVEESKGSTVKLIEEFHLPAIYCYGVPEKGDCNVCAELEAAIEYYDYADNTVEPAEPESYLYHVTIQVFGEAERDDENGESKTNNDKTNNGFTEQMAELASFEEGKEKLYQEYERMLSIGLDVSLSEDYELTGVLSHEEIEGFVPYPEYGYVFRLVNENF